MLRYVLNVFQVLCLLALGLIECSFNEKDQLSILIDKIETFNNSYYENIYVHTNKEIFQPGERLWFKAYVTGIAANASKSTTLYCLISNASGKRILLKRFHIIDGLCGGDIELDENLKDGSYKFTFFTTKSEVSGSSFKREIQIKNYTSGLEVGSPIIQSENVDQKFPVESIVYIGNDSLHIEIPIQENIADDIFLFVSIHGELFWASEETLKINNKISLALSELPVGMVTITGFNKSENIILRNTITINDSKRSDLCIKLDKQSYSSGETTKLDVSLVNKKGFPTPADLSVSVYVKELNTTTKSKNIVQYMSKSENLESGLSEQNPSSIKEESYVINGHITHPKDNLKGIPILAIDKIGEIYYETETYEDGTFSFNVDSAFYNTEFLVGIENNKEDRLTIMLEDTVRVTPLNSLNTDISTSYKSDYVMSDSVYLKNYLDHQFLEEVVIQRSRIVTDSAEEVILFDYYDNVKVEKIKGEDISLMAGQSFLDILRQITTIHLVNQIGNVFFSRGLYNNTPVLFVLNNVPIGHDYRVLNSIPTIIISEIKVIKNIGAVTQFGQPAQGGVVLITTKDIISNLVEPNEPLINTSMTKSVRFYEPKNEFAQSDRLESCAFWKDNVIIDHNGNASLTFENLPLSGTMVVRIEGIDENRNFISLETSYILN